MIKNHYYCSPTTQRMIIILLEMSFRLCDIYFCFLDFPKMSRKSTIIKGVPKKKL